MNTHDHAPTPPDCACGPTPDLTLSPPLPSRRVFVKTAALASAATIAAVGSGSPLLFGKEEAATKNEPENLVKALYKSLTPEQKEEFCYEWDYKDDRGLLRAHVSNNWQISDANIGGKLFTKDQQDMIEAMFWGLYQPDWHDRIKKQLKDDAGGYGKHQSIALFGNPEEGPFQLVMTGRHLTIRCDGDTTPHAAFGGPIFYGHAAEEFNEKPNHAGNVFWPQALKANSLYQMLDGKQREQALIAQAPPEAQIHFAKGKPPAGLMVAELSKDQKAFAADVLATLVEPYRQIDRNEIEKCLAANGGLDQCRLSFFKSGDLGNNGVWDNWRLEGPSFVWHYRGAPHVHVWVNIADTADFEITTRG
ncbi:MAG: hypothetical protein C0478_01075 [Planctomyces sp.]|nr:hypothetical protein [Planctomyces sp.]